MADIVIRKRVNLEFLGEDYKEDFLVFKAMPVSEFEDILPELEKERKGKESVQFIKSILKDHFIEGIFDKQKVDKEDLDKFDIDTLTKCFGIFTGQDNPKS